MSARTRQPPGLASAPEPRTGASSTRPYGLAALALLLLAQAFALARHATDVLPDDTLFYFFYVDNLAAGNGYRFNASEPPVCGASAPLWPPLLAAVKCLGLSTEGAALATSWALTLASTALLGLLLLRTSGPLGVLGLAALLVPWQLHAAWAVSGMETPMTYLLIAGALAVASGAGGWALTGTVAGACLVHKLDLAPLGLALLAGSFRWRRPEALRALVLAAAIALAWYAYATWLFGSPLPNSLRTKLEHTYGEVPRSWFAQTVFLRGAGALRTVLALVGLLALRRRPFLLAVALTQILAPTAAFTWKVPNETFWWYATPLTPVLGLLAAAGLAFLLRAQAEHVSRAQLALAAVAIVPLGLLGWRQETPLRREMQEFLACCHGLLREAGRWVDRHTPPDARVLTFWGNPAYYSRRFVYDATFLNRPPEPDIFLHAPEVWIHSQFGRFDGLVPRRDYRLAQLFEASPPCAPFFAAVLVFDPRPGSAAQARPGRDPGRIERLRTLARDAGTPAFRRAQARIEQRLQALGPRQRRAVVRGALERWPELAPLLPPPGT
ncbi:MAG TPA: hypothetical protein VF530_23615 [Planctomycetota bacterium]